MRNGRTAAFAGLGTAAFIYAAAYAQVDMIYSIGVGAPTGQTSESSANSAVLGGVNQLRGGRSAGVMGSGGVIGGVISSTGPDDATAAERAVRSEAARRRVLEDRWRELQTQSSVDPREYLSNYNQRRQFGRPQFETIDVETGAQGWSLITVARWDPRQSFDMVLTWSLRAPTLDCWKHFKEYHYDGMIYVNANVICVTISALIGYDMKMPDGI